MSADDGLHSSGAAADAPLGLFDGFGIELEYMIVGGKDLSVLPVADEVLRSVAGEIVSDVEIGDTAWSNELVLHVIELKTNGPAPALRGLDRAFQRDVARINGILEPMGGRLMPGAMHPWMDPDRETRLWPHEYNAVYEAFNRIFDCRGHGWSNLQSMHVNLPFANDEEFGRLHAAIRLVIPLIPAIAASSPVRDGRATGILDSRLEAYRRNCATVPSLTAAVVPEPVFDIEAYHTEILERLYRDIAPHDPGGILREEWLNARGAIARFDRNAIEIRVIDVQECPRADLAVAALVGGTVKLLCEERWSGRDAQRRPETGPLADLLGRAAIEGENAAVEDTALLRLFGMPGSRETLGAIWRKLAPEALAAFDGDGRDWERAAEVILERGPLARRILTALHGDDRRGRLVEVYGELCRCLAEGRLFTP